MWLFTQFENLHPLREKLYMLINTFLIKTLNKVESMQKLSHLTGKTEWEDSDN